MAYVLPVLFLPQMIVRSPREKTACFITPRFSILILISAPAFDKTSYYPLEKQTIHFQTYIFDSDETGKLIAEALMLASKRGVKVFLMVDGYASQKMPKPFLNKLIFSGVNFRFFGFASMRICICCSGIEKKIIKMKECH